MRQLRPTVVRTLGCQRILLLTTITVVVVSICNIKIFYFTHEKVKSLNEKNLLLSKKIASLHAQRAGSASVKDVQDTTSSSVTNAERGLEITQAVREATRPKIPCNTTLDGKVEVNISKAEAAYWKLSGFTPPNFENSSGNVFDSRVMGNYSKSTFSPEQYVVNKEDFLYQPQGCNPVQTVAIIIPFRDREAHLRILLGHLVPILKKQRISYGILVVEQFGDSVFNKGRVMNSGFKFAIEISKKFNVHFDCYIFHDVDMLVEHDTLIYECSKRHAVNHFAALIDKFDYQTYRYITVGGAVGFTEEQYRKVNGFSNLYWGWGGEDDDMKFRLKNKDIAIQRPVPPFGRYTMVKHPKDHGNPINPERIKLYRTAHQRFDTDGLSDLRTRIVRIDTFPLFIKLYVDVDNVVCLRESEILKRRE